MDYAMQSVLKVFKIDKIHLAKSEGWIFCQPVEL